MLTLKELLADAAASPGFEAIAQVGVNSRSSSGESPLHRMSTLGDSKAISLLLQAGALIDATDGEGNTPLHEAVSRRQTQAVQALLEHAASLTIRNEAGKTPEDLAKEDGFAPVSLLFQRP
jgi:uncharacterized protein